MDVVLVAQVVTAGIPRDNHRGHKAVLVVLILRRTDRKVARERYVDRGAGMDQIV